jgi:hypothetical protein
LNRILFRIIPASFLALAAGGAFAQFFLKHVSDFGPVDWCAWFLALLVSAGICWVLADGRWSTHRTLLVILAAVAVSRLALLSLIPDFPQLADRRFFLDFLNRWAAGGDGELRRLSWESYDFPVWLGRAWPFAYPLVSLFGARAVLALQLAQVALLVLFCRGIWALARRTGSSPAAATALAAVAPPAIWQVLEFAYHIQIAVFLLCAFLVFARIADGLKEGRRPWASALALGCLLFLLHLQAGLDLVMVAVFLCTAVVMGLDARTWPARGRIAAFVLLIPLAVAAPAGRAFDAWMQARNEGRLASGFLVRVAVGLNTENWGEYTDSLVSLDWETPAGRKNRVMGDYIARQIRENLFDVMVKLPVVKLVKLYQLGAATGIEEALKHTCHPWSWRVFRGCRVAFALFLLPVAAWGALRFFREPLDPIRTALGFYLVGMTAAYTFLIETSPRYAFYLLFALALCAAEAFVPRPGRRRTA